jgi:polyhydroxyalkanoate synthesis regulator phasin
METLRDDLSESQWPDAEYDPESEHEREMGALQELLAASNVEAAQEKVDAIIRAAQADGRIDEDYQRQINDARSELEAIKQRRTEAAKAMEEVRASERVCAYFAKGANDVGGRLTPAANVFCRKDPKSIRNVGRKRRQPSARNFLQGSRKSDKERRPRRFRRLYAAGFVGKGAGRTRLISSAPSKGLSMVRRTRSSKLCRERRQTKATVTTSA